MMDKSLSFRRISFICSAWSLFALIYAGFSSATAGCCGDSTETDPEWTLVMNYANFDAPAYGDSTTTHCQCRQACYDLKGCTGYDWFPAGTTTKCWVGNNSKVALTADDNNQHYVPNTKLSCYSSEIKSALKWRLVKTYANWDAPAYGDSKTTHCQCRQACIDLDGCTGYDWFPAGTTTKCWVSGSKCNVTMTYDANNEHYIPSTKTKCYADAYRGVKADINLDKQCNRDLCPKHQHHDD